jgi:hypothetical protein
MRETDGELTQAERAVLEVAAGEGRVNVTLVTEQTPFDEPAVTDALETLEVAGAVAEVSAGLYEYTPDSTTDSDAGDAVRGIPDPSNEDTVTAPIDPTSVDEDADSE